MVVCFANVLQWGLRCLAKAGKAAPATKNDGSKPTFEQQDWST
jgi:hypothetical protein